VKIKIVDLLFCHDWRAAVFFPLLFVPQMRPNPFNPSIGTRPEQKLEHSKTIKSEKSDKNQKCLHVELRLRVNRKQFVSSQISKSSTFSKTIFLKKAFSTTKTGCGFFIVANSNSLLHDLQVTLKGT
jgi:hypothetical protein